MRINRLTVQNFRCFDEKSWDFTPGFNVLIGDNGTGKTAVLDALKIALGAFIAGFPGERFERIEARDIRLVRGGTEDQPVPDPVTPVHIRASGEINGQKVSWRRSVLEGNSNKGSSERLRSIASVLSKEIHSGQEPLLPLVAYYSARRLWPTGLTSEKLLILVQSAQRVAEKMAQKEVANEGVLPTPVLTDPPSRFDGYNAALSAQANSKAVEQWFTRLTLSSLQRGKPNTTLDAVRAAGVRCLPEWDDVYYDPLTNSLTVSNKMQVLPAHFLSDGQRNILFMVLDIAYRCALLNPTLRNEAAAKTPGVVLIDELDLHLHPKWQRHIVNDLRRVFPHIQFIATTHSPLIIQSLRAGELIDLGPQVDEEPEKYVNKSPEDILENVQNVYMPQKSERSLEMVAAAERYYNLLAKVPDSSDLPQLRRELDVAMEPFEEDPALIAALRLERRASGVDKEAAAPKAVRNGDSH